MKKYLLFTLALPVNVTKMSFVRASKYRHVYGTPARRENCYENVKASMNAWDTNLLKVNPVQSSSLLMAGFRCG